MAVSIKITSIDRDIQLLTNELLSPAARSKMLATAALEILQETDAANRSVLGRVPKSKTYVDGRQGAAIQTVKPDGIIVRDYELVNDVILFLLDLLRSSSPVGKGPDRRPGHPGFYKKSHILFADGREVGLNEALPEALEYVILSSAEYARRIEKRTTIYERAAAQASRRFGNIAKVYFSYRSPILPYVQGGRNRAERAAQRNQPAKQSAKHLERATRVPAIVVTVGR